MKVTFAVILGSMLVVSGSAVYAQGGAQASSSASSSTSAQADKSGASASSNNSGSTSAQAGQRSASLASGTAMNAALSQPVDAKKNKPGDQVTAKTTEANWDFGGDSMCRLSRKVAQMPLGLAERAAHFPSQMSGGQQHNA